LNSSTSNRKLGLLLGLIGVIIFGGTLPATRIAVAVFDPWFVTFGRAAVASVAALIMLIVLKRPVPWRHGYMLLVAGIFVVVGFPGFMALAMLTLPAAHGGVVLGILPLATAIFAALIGGERPSIMFWFWGFVGTLLVAIFALREGGVDGGIGLVIGDIWLLLAALCASCGYVILAKISHHMAGWEAISWALIVTIPISLAGSILTWNDAFLEASSFEFWAFLYLAMFSMFLGFFAWNTGLRLGGISRVGQLQLLQTFVTLAIAAVLLGEEISLETMMFALAVLVVIVLGQKARVE
jgi:drug/metabolite transporter (DMT)-like permease